MIDFYGAIFIAILGTVLHFTYDISNHNKYILLFSSVNESVWEHMKLVVFPSLLWTLIEIPFLYKNPNFLTAKCISLIVMLLFIPIFFEIFKLILKKNYLFIDILIFYCAIFLGQYLSYVILKHDSVMPIYNYLSLLILLITYGYFLIATIIPGKSNIYVDPITKKKGIKGHRF